MRDMISDTETTSDGETWLPRWDGAAYAGNAGHHRAYDTWFLESLPIRPTDRVLDVGCGAGDFTATVARLLTEGEIVGLDAQPSQLAEARARALPNQSFVEGAVQDLATLIPGSHSFDLIFSRAVLHWVPAADHLPALIAFHRLLKPGGWVRLEFGGAGNIPAMLPLLDSASRFWRGPASPWFFPDAAQYLALLEAAGFSVADGHVRTVAQRRAFDESSLRGWLNSQALAAYEYSMAPASHAGFRAEVEARLAEARRPDGTWDQTFVRLDALARPI